MSIKVNRICVAIACPVSHPHFSLGDSEVTQNLITMYDTRYKRLELSVAHWGIKHIAVHL